MTEWYGGFFGKFLDNIYLSWTPDTMSQFLNCPA